LNRPPFSWACFFFGIWWSLYTRTWRVLWLQLAGYLGVAVVAFVLGLLNGLDLLGGHIEVGKTVTFVVWQASHAYIAWKAPILRAESLKRELGLLS
jgi:hypothetical protein